MLCLNAPRKPMARIHILISLLLVVACAVLAVMPLTQIVVSDETVNSIHNLFEYIESQQSGESAEEANAAIEKMMNSLDLENASVGISVLGMKDSVKPITQLSEIMAKMMKANGDDEKMEGYVGELKDVFINEEGEIRDEVKDLVIIMAALAGPMIPDDPSTMNEDKIGDMISAGIPSMLGLILSLLLAVIIPIIFVVLVLITLITALTSLRDPVIGAAKISKRLPKSVVHPMTVLLATCLSTTVAPTMQTYIMLGIAGLGTLLNVVNTRIHTWNKQELRYANAVQVVSLFSIGAYVFFFINLLKMGVFKSFLSKLIPYFMNSKSPSPDVYIDIAMIGVAVFFALISTKYLAKVLRRLSLACSPKKKGGAHCTHLVYALFLFSVTVLPMMALGSKANNGAPFLAVTVEQEYALLFGFGAVALMALTEIVLLILRKACGKGLTKAQIADIMTNVSEKTNDEPALAESSEEGAAQEGAESAEEVEDASALTPEAVPEEEAAEETPSEEAPAAEETAEEPEAEAAPAEEAEAPAEDAADKE